MMAHLHLEVAKTRVERLEIEIVGNLQRGHGVLGFDSLGKTRARLKELEEKFKKQKKIYKI
jgi:hypothetical protein